MKVLRVISTMNPINGGPSQGIRNSIYELAKLGIDNEVVSLDSPDESFIVRDDFIIHALGPYKGPWFYNSNLFPWLIKNISNYEAVIIHGLWLYHGYAVFKAFTYLSKNKINLPKLYIMPHGMLDPYFQKASGRRIKAVRNWMYWKLIERKLIKYADALLFTTESELLLARESFKPYNPKREINIGYGIKRPPLYTKSMKEAFLKQCPDLLNKPYLLFLSRIHEKKGVDLIIDAYSSLFKNKDEYTVIPQLVIAGPGLDSNYGNKILATVKNDAWLSSSIFFPGMLMGDAKWGAFYCCDAFILPSHQENFGIAVAEALACSKAVLISDQVNIWNEIKVNNAGFVEPDTLEGTQKIIKNWLKLDETSKKIMMERAEFVFEKKFNITIAVQNLYKILTENK